MEITGITKIIIISLQDGVLAHKTITNFNIIYIIKQLSVKQSLFVEDKGS